MTILLGLDSPSEGRANSSCVVNCRLKFTAWVFLSLNVLAPSAVGADFDEVETVCSDRPMPVQEIRRVDLRATEGPWVTEDYQGFMIHVPFESVRTIMEYRRVQLFSRGLDGVGTERFLAEFERLSADGRDIAMSELIPTSEEVWGHWERFEATKNINDPAAFESFEYSRAVAHQYAPVALISYALQSGMAMVTSPSGDSVGMIHHLWFTGLDEKGYEVEGVSFRDADGDEVFSTCQVTPTVG